MSIAPHFDALSVYRARAVRIVPESGDPEDLLDEGGGLEESFEKHGRGPLIAVLRDVAVRAVLLADGDLEVEAQRILQGALLQVRWGGRTVVEENVAIPPPVAAGNGPFFRPDPDAGEIGRASCRERV